MDFSTILVAVIVLLAAAYLVRRFIKITKGEGGCSCGSSKGSSACSSCPSCCAKAKSTGMSK